MKVVLVVGHSTGGIGTHVGQLSADLRALDHDVRLVTDAATARRFGWDGEAGTLTWWPRDAGSLRRWSRRLRDLAADADVVHAHGIQAGAAVALAGLPGWRDPAGARRPGRLPLVVVSLHNQPPARGLGGRVGEALARVAVRRADLATGASSDLVTLVRRLGARDARLAAVPSPLVPALLAAPAPGPAERAALVADLGLGARPLVLTVSRIAPQKRLDVVVAAAGQLRHRPEICWAVAGDGDPDLRADLVSAAGGGEVVLLGARTDVPALLRAASVLVVSSDWEARALVVQEAMAAGTPVVATDVGGLRDLVGGTGVLVPPGSATALATALDEVLDEVLDEPSEDVPGDPSREPTPTAARARAGRAVAASWADGPETARQWVRWYTSPRP